jgi:ATP-dependent exoDNAse (exonuclease V) alpha subunit
MVNKYGEDIVDVLDSPDAVAKLSGCEGVGRSKALKIKEGWDAGKDARLGSQFLRDAGVPAALAQRVAESLTSRTQEVVTADPYAALGSFGLPLTTVDGVAASMDAPADLVSRAVAAFERCLVISAEREGHTYLPWSKLENEARKLLDDLGLQHGNPWPRDEALFLVAQHMHESGRLVAEPGGDLTSSVSFSTPSSKSSSKKTSVTNTGEHVMSSSGSGNVDETLKMMVSQRLTGATSQQITAMFDFHGVDLPLVLNLPPIDAVRELARCKRIGPKTAEKLKLQWDAWSAAHSTSSTNAASSSTRFGLQLSDLEDTPPNVPFEWGPDVRCYLPRLHKAEVTVAQTAGEKSGLVKKPSAARTTRIKKWISANQNSNGVELSQGQCAAIEAASDAPLLVITGGPGCGKTTVVQAIVKLWSAQGKKVHIAAPTGRAAQRMGVIQGIEPSTIHRLLKFQPRGESSTSATAAAASGNGGGDGIESGNAAGDVGAEIVTNGDEFDSGPGGFFELGASNKLHSDAVLVDEASMLSLPLAAALMQALEPTTQLILIGDVDQLPPIGAGGVLHSMITSGIAPVVDLREIFRQAAKSSIVTGALAVRQGEIPKLRHANPSAEELLDTTETDAFIVRASDSDSVPELVYQTVGALAGDDNFIESDLQVITPMRKGPTGSTTLNLKLQNLLNPPEDGKKEVSRGAHGPGTASGIFAGGGSGGNGSERVFRVGDRVLQLVNNYDKDVFNGDQGYIIEVYPWERRLIVDFPQSDGRAAADGESKREYQGMELAQLELAYAITVHKAQGGEAKHVVMALSPQHGRMLTRRLLYTGMTRAKDLLVIVAPGSGDSDNRSTSSTCPLVTAVKHRDSDVRLSSLTERLEQERKARSLVLHSPEVFSNEEEVLQGNLDAALDDSSATASSSNETTTGIKTTPRSAASTKSSTSAVSEKKEVAEVEELVTLPMLCQDLGLSSYETESLIAMLSSTIDAQQAPLVSAATVHAYLAKLQAVCDKKSLGTLPEVSRVLRLAPLLLVASAEYFDRGLTFSNKFGPLVPVAEESVDQNGQNHNDDSLVDQLRRVLGAASSNSS